MLKQLLISLSLLIGAGCAIAQPVDDDSFRYLLGLGINNGPEAPGASHRSSGGGLIWAVHWGKWRLSTSGASALMGFGNVTVGPGSGASRDLLRSENFRLGFGLRFDNGRKSEDLAVTAGLPDVQRTLLGRVYASYTLSKDWQLAAAVNQDLLSKGGGLVWNADLSHQLFASKTSALSAGIGISGSDGRHMRSYFGVPVDTAAALRFGHAYLPDAGLRDASIGVSYTRAITPRWVGFANFSASRLLGQAADSPLTQNPTGVNWSLGLAYRN